MNTFVAPKELDDDPGYVTQRLASLAAVDLSTLDPPIMDVMEGFRALPCCFTLQSCYGHFICGTQRDPNNTQRLPTGDCADPVAYRIAYVALCVENGRDGRELLRALEEVASRDPAYVQYGSAEWFWRRRVNTYVLQVEPFRHRRRDKITVDYAEALQIQQVRDRFFGELRDLLKAEQWATPASQRIGRSGTDTGS